MTNKPTIEGLLADSDRESGRYVWEGTFADYLRMVIRDPSVSRLSHKLVYGRHPCQGVRGGAHRGTGLHALRGRDIRAGRGVGERGPLLRFVRPKA